MHPNLLNLGISWIGYQNYNTNKKHIDLSRFKSSLLCIELYFLIYIWNKHISFLLKVQRMRRRVQRGVTFSERGATHYQFVTSRSNLVQKFWRFLRDEFDVAKYGKERWSYREIIKIQSDDGEISSTKKLCLGRFQTKPGRSCHIVWNRGVSKTRKTLKQTNEVEVFIFFYEAWHPHPPSIKKEIQIIRWYWILKQRTVFVEAPDMPTMHH